MSAIPGGLSYDVTNAASQTGIMNLIENLDFSGSTPGTNACQ